MTWSRLSLFVSVMLIASSAAQTDVALTATELWQQTLPQALVQKLRKSMTPDQVRSVLGPGLGLVGPVDLGAQGAVAFGVYFCPQEYRDCNKISEATDPRVKDTGLLLSFFSGKLAVLQQTRYSTTSRNNDHLQVLTQMLTAAGDCKSSTQSSKDQFKVYNQITYKCANTTIIVGSSEWLNANAFSLSIMESWPAP